MRITSTQAHALSVPQANTRVKETKIIVYKRRLVHLQPKQLVALKSVLRGSIRTKKAKPSARVAWVARLGEDDQNHASHAAWASSMQPPRTLAQSVRVDTFRWWMDIVLLAQNALKACMTTTIWMIVKCVKEVQSGDGQLRMISNSLFSLELLRAKAVAVGCGTRISFPICKTTAKFVWGKSHGSCEMVG